MTVMTEERAALTAAQRNALPDSAFAYIEPDGTRHFPIHDASHVRNALARIAQGAKFGAEALPKVKAAAKKFGINSDDSSSLPRPNLELLKRRRNSMIRLPERRGLPFARGNIELRARPNGTGGTAYEFRGYSATFVDEFEVWDKWGDPFIETLAASGVDRTLGEKPDTRFFIGHNDSDLALARTAHGDHPGTMTLSKDLHGLETFVPALDGRSSKVMDLVIAVERGDMDQMSIGFVTRGQEWSADYEHRTLTDIDLHNGDVSVVAIPANPGTSASIAAVPVSDALSKRWAEQRASIVANAAAATHEPMSGSHEHLHAGDDGVLHVHVHDHDDDADHDHMHAEVAANAGGGVPAEPADRAAGRPVETRANPVDQDMGDGPDYSAAGQVKCTNAGCAHQADVPPPGASHCAYCGDALVRIDDQGVPGMEEEQGGAASLALRRRQLELLRLAG